MASGSAKEKQECLCTICCVNHCVSFFKCCLFVGWLVGWVFFVVVVVLGFFFFSMFVKPALESHTSYSSQKLEESERKYCQVQ